MSDTIKSCFIISAIGDENSEIRQNADDLYTNIFKPICDEYQFDCIRIDKLNKPDNINNQIIKYLNESALVIADLTHLNPNVFFEIGYRSAIKKPIIHMAEEGVNLPFDIAQFKCLYYSTKGFSAGDKIKSQLKDSINSIDFNKTLNSEQPNQNDNWVIEQSIANLADEIDSLKNHISNLTNTIVSNQIRPKQDTSAKIEELFIENLVSSIVNDPEKLLKFVDISKKL